MANVCVNDLFNGKNIFVTGGSGFIGKVLIEKLLRTFDGINTIYILLREKKGRSIEERLKLITDNQLFDKLKKLKPHAIKKIVPINGDAKDCGLGMSAEDRQVLIENVHIIYHAAASVRFDDFLKDAILLNTRGTRDVANLALEIKNLVAFMHISTTYCNTDKQVVEEKIYPPHADWRTTIKMAETLDQHTLDIIAPKYMDPLPNTYTFAKSLAEHVVNDLCKGKIPAVIFRPSVVISTFDDPIPGWIDNFNGPVGLLIAGGIGLLRVTLCDPERKPDYIPVDTLIKMLIVCTKERLLNKDLDDVLVYNAASGGRAICKNGDLVELGRSLTWNAPCSQIIWYPSFSMTSNWYVYYTMHLLFHMLPALFVDGLRKLSGRKPMLIKIQRKIYIANTALIYFMWNEWNFRSEKAVNLCQKLKECDEESLSFTYLLSLHDQEIYTFYIKAKIGAMKAMFHEEFDMNASYRVTKIMWIIHSLLKIILFLAVLWYLYARIDIIYISLQNKFNDIVMYWNNL